MPEFKFKRPMCKSPLESASPQSKKIWAKIQDATPRRSNPAGPIFKSLQSPTHPDSFWLNSNLFQEPSGGAKSSNSRTCVFSTEFETQFPILHPGEGSAASYT